MGLAKTYLLAYNASLILGWGYVLVLAGIAFADKGAAAVYDAVEVPLLLAQTAACLEVVHAMVGIARSPVLVTAMQVSSRLMVVWGVLYVSPPSRVATLPLATVGGVGSCGVLVVLVVVSASPSELLFYMLDEYSCFRWPVGERLIDPTPPVAFPVTSL